LEGTFWAGDDAYGSRFVLEFQEAGKLLYIPVAGTISKGAWKQNGNDVRIEMNGGFAEFTGTLEGNRLGGDASNKRGMKWKWSATKQPVVSETSLPTYPPLARAARIEGMVIVDLEVDASGVVTGIRSIMAHPLLRAASERAAKNWKFEPAKEDAVRLARLVFVFLRLNEPDEKVASTKFLSPYQVEIRSGIFLIQKETSIAATKAH
jgi:TonB family protein